MQEAEMLDAPDRCSRIHGRTALHSQRINLSVFQDTRPRFVRVEPIRGRVYGVAVDRQ